MTATKLHSFNPGFQPYPHHAAGGEEGAAARAAAQSAAAGIAAAAAGGGWESLGGTAHLAVALHELVTLPLQVRPLGLMTIMVGDCIRI